jgi:glycosyltransferase involved in cell wall biosynthesis
MKKLSVITICYNDLEGLQKTVQNVLLQQREIFEYIIIDGASKDGTQDYLKASADLFDVVVSEPDKGIYDALNKGWQKSSGEFVLFMNAGDVFASSDVIEKAIPFLTEEVDIAYGDAHLSDRSGIYHTKKHPEHIASIWMIKEVIAHQSQFIRKSLLFNNNGYDLQFRIAADYAFLAKVFWKQQVRFKYLPFVVSVFDTEGISSSPEQKSRVEQERKAIHNAYAPFWIRFVYYTYAKINRWIGR